MKQALFHFILVSQFSPSFLSANLCSRSSEVVGFGEVSGSVSHRPLSVYHLHSSPVSPSSSHRYIQLWKREHSQECCLHSSNVWTSYSALPSQILYSHRGLLLPLVSGYKRNHILFPTLHLCTIYLLALGCGLLVDWLPSTPMTLNFRGNNTKLHRGIQNKYIQHGWIAKDGFHCRSQLVRCKDSWVHLFLLVPSSAQLLPQ